MTTSSEIDLAALEAAQIEKCRQSLETLRIFEEPLRKLAGRKYSPEQLLDAEGKRCIIQISKLHYHSIVLFFQVTNFTIQQVEPYENYDTWVQVPIWRINQLFDTVLSGQRGAFGDLVATGDVKVKGKKTAADIMAWSNILDELADNIERLRT